MVAGQLGGMVGPLGGAHDRDLRLGPELLEDLAGLDGGARQPRLAVDQVARGERVIDHQHRGLWSTCHLRAFALARGERLR